MIIENNVSKKKDKRLIQFIIGYSFFSMLNTAIKSLMPMSNTTWQLLSYLTGFIIFFLLIRSISIALSRKGRLFVIIEALFVALITYSILIGTKIDSTLITKSITTLGICVTSAIYIAAIFDLNEYYRYWGKMSSIFILIISISMIFGVRNEVLGSYSQTLGYSLLIPIMFQIDIALDSNKLINYFKVLIGLIVLILFGSRGPLFPIFVYLVLRIFLGIPQKGKRWIIIIISIFLLLGIFLSYDFILEKIQEFLWDSGINSYTLNRIINESFRESEARTKLLQIYWKLIKERPIWGWGIYGGMIGEGLSPHNGIFDILMAFGFIIGIPICIILILLVLRIVFVDRGIYQKLLLIYGSCIIRLFFYSGNIFGNLDLFIFVSLSLRHILEKKRVKNRNMLES